MKKIYILALIASVIMFAGCQKEFDGIINAEIEDYVGGDDKVYIDADNFASWHIGDMIKVNGTDCPIYIDENGKATIKTNVSANTYTAIYPANYAAQNGSMKFTIPESRLYREKAMPNDPSKMIQVVDAPMIADTTVVDGETPTLKFRNAGALLKIIVHNPSADPMKLRTITVSSKSNISLSGGVTDMSSYKPGQTNSSSTYYLTLDFQSEGATPVTIASNDQQTFYLAVPCVESNFITEILYTNTIDHYNYKYTSKATKKAKIKRNTIATFDLNEEHKSILQKLSKGSGTQTDPYLIENIEDYNHLCDISSTVNSNTYYKQTANFTREGNKKGPYDFKGHYDGGGFTITINTNGAVRDAGGVFNSLNDADISNLKVHITSNQTRGEANWPTGGITDQLMGDGTVIENCEVTGSIESNNYVGGIVGNVGTHNITIRNCTVNANITGTKYVGGFIGNQSAKTNKTTTIEECTYSGQLNAPTAAGGMIGYASKATPIKITSCTNNGTLNYTGNPQPYFGGIIGEIQDANTDNLTESNNTIQPGQKLIGNIIQIGDTPENPILIHNENEFMAMANDLTKCYKLANNFTLTWNFHGLSGFSGNLDGNGKTITNESSNSLFNAISYGATIKNLTVDVNVTNFTIYGAIVNNISLKQQDSPTNKDIMIENCHVTGSIDGRSVGGLIGNIDHYLSYTGTITIKNCTNRATIVGSGLTVGGIVSYCSGAKIMVNECTNYGNISVSSYGTMDAGQIVGSLNNGAKMINCHENGSLTIR